MPDFAGALSVGTLVGGVTLDDQLSPVAKRIAAGLDEVDARLNKTGASVSSFADKLDKVASSLKGVGVSLTAGLTVPLTAAAGIATKFSQDFEAAMTKVVTLSTNTEAEMQGLRDGVLALAPTVGIGPQALADALLVVTSAGYKGKEAMDILTASAKASAVGLGDTKDVARAVTSVIAAYGSANITAAHATDVLYKAVVEGKAEASEFAGALGPIVGIAAKLGVSFEELSGFVATYSRLGVNADEASTALRGTLTSLLGETQEGKKALQTYGLTVDDILHKIGKQGLAATLIELTETFKGNNEAMNAVFGNVRALAGVMGVTGTQSEQLTKILAHLKSGTNELDEAFTRTTKNQSFTWSQLTAQVQVLAIKFGDALAPSLKKVMDNMAPLLDMAAQMLKAFTELPAPVQQTAVALLAVAAALGPVAFAAGSVISGVTKIAGAVKLLVGAEALGAVATTASGAASGIVSIGTAAVTSAAGITLMSGAVVGLGVALIALVAIRAKEALDAQAEALDNATKNAVVFEKTMKQASDLLGHQVTNLEDAQRDLHAYAAGLRGVTLESMGVKDVTVDMAAAWTKGMEAAGHVTTEVGKQITVHLKNTEAVKAGTAALNTHTNALVSQATIYKQAQAQVTGLTAAEREELTAGKAMGRQATDNVAAFNARFGAQRAARGETILTVEAEHLFEEALQKTEQQLGKTTKALDEFFGVDTVKKAEALAQELGNAFNVNTGDWTSKFKLTEDQIAKVNTQMNEGIVTLNQLGKVAPATMLQWAAATEKVTKGMTEAVGVTIDAGQAWMEALQKTQELSQRAQVAQANYLNQELLQLKFAKAAELREIEHFAKTDVSLHKQMTDQINKYYDQMAFNALASSKEMAKGMELAGYAIPGLGMALSGLQATQHQSAIETVKWSDSLSSLANSMTQLAQISGSTFGTIAKSIGQVVVSFDAAWKAGQHFKDALTKAGGDMKKVGAAMAMDLASGLIGGITGIMSAADIKNKAGSAIMGGLSGAAAGAITGYVLAGAAGGPWGALAGFVVGAIVAVWKGAETRNIMHQVGRQWGSDISKGLAESIKVTAKETFGGNKDAAQIFLLSDTIAEKGITTAKSYQTAIGKLRDTFSMLEVVQTPSKLAVAFGALEGHLFTTAQAQKVLNENFSTFTNMALKNGVGLITGQMKELVELDRRFETGSQVIADFVAQQLSRAAGGFNKIAAGFGETWGKITQKVSDGIKDVEDHQDELHKKLSAQIPKNAAEFQRLGRLAVAAFGSAIKSGMSAVDALAAIKDGLNVLSSAVHDGFVAEGGLAELIGLNDFVAKNPAVVDAAAGINDMLQGLANSAFLDQQTFVDLGDEAVATFNKMVAGGASGDQAMRLMQPTLQTIWELQKDFGYAVDEGTQALLDQAEAAGIVGDKQRSIQEKMLIALEGINTAINGIATAMGVTLPQAAESGAAAAGAAFDGLGRKIGDAMDQVPKGGFTIPYTFEPTNSIPDPTHGGSGSTPTGQPHARPGEVPEPGERGYIPPHRAAGGSMDQMQYLAGGGLVDKLARAWSSGSDNMLAMMNKDEYVVRAPAAEAIGKSTLDYINQMGQLPTKGMFDAGPYAWGGHPGMPIPSITPKSLEDLSKQVAAKMGGNTGIVPPKILDQFKKQLEDMQRRQPRITEMPIPRPSGNTGIVPPRILEQGGKQSGGGDVSIILMKSSGDANKDEAAIWATLSTDVKQNKHGLRTKLRQALGIVQ